MAKEATTALKNYGQYIAFEGRVQKPHLLPILATEPMMSDQARAFCGNVIQQLCDYVCPLGMPPARHAPNGHAPTGHACPWPCTSPGHAHPLAMHAPGHACPPAGHACRLVTHTPWACMPPAGHAHPLDIHALGHTLPLAGHAYPPGMHVPPGHAHTPCEQND